LYTSKAFSVVTARRPYLSFLEKRKHCNVNKGIKIKEYQLIIDGIYYVL